MNPDQISVVLVEPQGPLNIGSVCRAMANFGFSDLRLVAPAADHLGDEARKMAVKSAALLEGARIFPDLRSALEDVRLAFGTTRRFGKYREEFLLPRMAGTEAAAESVEGRVALVFGREDCGLLTAELDLCQRLVTIPTVEACPSMNLAQAASLLLYETASAAGQSPIAIPERDFASHAELEGMFAHMRSALLDIAYLDPQNPDHIMRAFRRLFSRARLDRREVRILQGLWSRIDWVEGERRKRGSGS